MGEFRFHKVYGGSCSIQRLCERPFSEGTIGPSMSLVRERRVMAFDGVLDYCNVYHGSRCLRKGLLPRALMQCVIEDFLNGDEGATIVF